MFWDWKKLEILEFGDYYVLFLQHHRGTQALPVLSHCLHLLSHLSKSLSPLSFYSNIVSLGRGGTGLGHLVIRCLYSLSLDSVQDCVDGHANNSNDITETTLSEQPVS